MKVCETLTNPRCSLLLLFIVLFLLLIQSLHLYPSGIESDWMASSGMVSPSRHHREVSQFGDFCLSGLSTSSEATGPEIAIGVTVTSPWKQAVGLFLMLKKTMKKTFPIFQYIVSKSIQCIDIARYENNIKSFSNMRQEEIRDVELSRGQRQAQIG